MHYKEAEQRVQPHFYAIKNNSRTENEKNFTAHQQLLFTKYHQIGFNNYTISLLIKILQAAPAAMVC